MLIIVDRFEGGLCGSSGRKSDKGSSEAGACTQTFGGRCCFSGYGRHLKKMQQQRKKRKSQIAKRWTHYGNKAA